MEREEEEEGEGAEFSRANWDELPTGNLTQRMGHGHTHT